MIHFNRRYCAIALACFFCQIALSQACLPDGTAATLAGNNVKSTLTNVGYLWDGNYQVPRAVLPQLVAPSALYAGALMVAGKNAAGTLKIAAQVSDGSGRGGTDFFQGPLDSVGNVTPTTCANFGKIFGVTALEINTLRSTNGFNLADNVRGWPAKGNPFFSAIHGFTLPNQDLAPFVDLNRDGIYNPSQGDYPDICGTHAYWWVFNDKGNTHSASKGIPLGIEVRGMAYCYSSPTDSVLDNSTIYNYEIIYKGTETLDSSFVGLWVDPDLGCNEDDYFGSSPANNMAFAYNADALDGAAPSGNCDDPFKKGYQRNIPLIGIKFLQTPKGTDGLELGMTNFMYHFTQSGTYAAKAGWAKSPIELYHYMSGRWRDGSPLTSGGDGTSTTNTATKYAYPIAPNNTTGWNMPNSSANVLEKAMIMSCGPFRMTTGSRHRLSFAVVPDLNATGHPRPDITTLINNANRLRNVCSFPTSVQNVLDKNIEVKVIPNPASDEASFICPDVINRISIYNLAGQLIFDKKSVNTDAFKLSTQTIQSGIYTYKISDITGKTALGRFAIMH